MRIKKDIVFGILSLGLVIGILFGDKILGYGHWKNVRVHSVIETVGAVAAFLMALLIFQMVKYGWSAKNDIFLGSGFLSMGVLDLFQATVSPGTPFVFLHINSNLFASAFFFMTLFSALVGSPLRIKIILTISGLLLIGVVFFSLSFSGSLPAMVTGNEFSKTAKDLNGISGFLFMISAVYFLKEYVKTKEPNRLLFSCLMFLFGGAGFIFETSHVWYPEWWIWHIVRLLAFLLSMIFIVNQFRRMAVDLYALQDRIKAEKKIGEQSQLVNNILNALGHPFYVINAKDYSLVLENPAARALGKSTDTTCYALTHHLDAPCLGDEHLCPLEEVKKTKGPVVVEHIHFDASGAPRDVEVRAYPILDSHGEVAQMIEYTIDITDRKKVEKELETAYATLEQKVQDKTLELAEALKESEDTKKAVLNLMDDVEKTNVELDKQKKEQEHEAIRLRVFMETSMDGIHVLDWDGNLKECNDAFLRHLGYSREEAGTLHISVWNSQWRREEVVEKVHELIEQGALFETKHRRKDGGLMDVEINACGVTLDGQPHLYCSSRDITERKKMEESIRKNLKEIRKLSQAVDQSAAVVVITDTTGKIEYVNPKFMELTGYTPEEAIGSNPRVLKSGEQPREFYEELWSTILAGKEWRGEFHNRKKNGELFWEQASISPVKDDNGQISHFIAVKEDVTERKKMERELAVKQKDLERSNQELEQFAYVASHDLQEPLRMISSYTQLLERRYQDLVDEKGRQYIYYAVDGATRMQQLISDLLLYSRVGTKSKEFKETDMNFVCQGALANLDVAIKENDAKVICDKMPVVMGDEGQLVQLLQNLIGNAMKFYGEQPPEVRFSVEEKEKEWLFALRDNGIGISPEYQERIFIIFQRLHTKQAYKGTGIGLAVCKKIVERHGGKIWVESRLGQGSVFYFTISKDRKKPDKET